MSEPTIVIQNGSINGFHCIEESSDLQNGSSENQCLTSFSILTEKSVKIDNKFLVEFSKGDRIIDRKSKRNCKILKFSSELSYEEIQEIIADLNREEYPNLFIFVIEAKNYGKNREEGENEYEDIKKNLLRFSETRPFVLQLTSENENATKIFYKDEDSTKFTVISNKYHKDIKVDDFESFYNYFAANKLCSSILHVLSREIKNSSLILRFLRILKMEDGFFGSAALEIAKNGTISDLLAALDVQFEGNGGILSSEAQDLIASPFDGEELDDKLESVLSVAIDNENKELINYLITNWSYLIQKLPFEHQVEISTTAFDKNMLDVLCDLLEIADYPFPKNFDTEAITHENLLKIASKRIKLKKAIQCEEFETIDELINTNMSLKYFYDPDNKSALTQAFAMRKFGVFYYLASFGFQGEDCEKILEKLSKVEKKKAQKIAEEQRKKNVNKSLQYANKSVLLLYTRSLIYNTRLPIEKEIEYREKILKWYEDINKIVPEMINVAASCENLKIIFDFESNSVESVALKGSSSLATTFSFSRWIFVGAKLSDKKREQEIKGNLAHELCHYVMSLVYENMEHPYFKHSVDLKNEFEKIVKKIREILSRNPDDECNRNISSVFTCYISNDIHPELIVTVVHNLVQFDDDEEKTKHLQNKYKVLYDFWEVHIIPELESFNLKDRENVRRLNGIFGLLSSIQSKYLKLTQTKDIKTLNKSKLVVATTNVPKLFLINIFNYLWEECGTLLNAQNLFVDPEKLCNFQICNDLRKVCEEVTDLRIFVDCTKGIPKEISYMSMNMQLSLVFIISNEDQLLKLLNFFEEHEMEDFTPMEVTYNWNDLKVDSQKLLLQAKINFQNNLQFSLMDLFKKDVDPAEPAAINFTEEEILKDFCEIIDIKHMNLLLEDSQVSINCQEEKYLEEQHFQFLFQERKFIKKPENKNNGFENFNGNEYSFRTSEELSEIDQEKLLEEIKDKKYVLVSDLAGNGKSWVMKNLANVLRKGNPTKWVKYIDLKQYIKEYKSQKTDPKFLEFMIEKFLATTEFEKKIFKKLYKYGKVLILFDGFDEIAPDYANLVLKLAASFEFNETNQLWIATRDYFEVNLQENLYILDTYKLGKFTEEDGVNLIVGTWVLNDLGSKNHIKTKNEFEKYVEMSPNLKEYRKVAEKTVQKAGMSEYRLVGLPQIFGMIANCFSDDKESANYLNGLEIYRKFMDELYVRWSSGKGEIRRDLNTKTQHNGPNFIKFHRFCALKSLLPKYATIFFPKYNGNEFSDEEIIGFGLMNKRNEEYYFLHETFREYFIADLIATKCFVDEEEYAFELLAEILTKTEYLVIRMLLNDSIKDYSVLEKIQPKMKNFISKFSEMEYMYDIFDNRLKFLSKFVMKIFISEDEIDATSLGKLVTERLIFHKVIKSSLDIEIFEELIAKIEMKTDRDFIRENLMFTSWDFTEGNVFYTLSRCSNLTVEKFRKFMEIIQRYLTVTEIFELMKCSNIYELNILRVCVNTGNLENFIILWAEIRNLFASKNLPNNFKKIVKQTDQESRNILHSAIHPHTVEFHTVFWNHLFELFEDLNELKVFILQKDKSGRNFIHEFIHRVKDLSIIEWTFSMLKEKFSNAQTYEFIKTKGEYDRNIFQTATYWAEDIKVHQFLWKFSRSMCKSNNDKLLDILKEVDKSGNNILHSAISMSSTEIFEFIIIQLKEMGTRDYIREILSTLNNKGENLLQSATYQRKPLKFYENLWKIFREYFTSSEIFRFIKHVDNYGFNVLFRTIYSQLPKNIVELTWKEIISFTDEVQQIEYVRINEEKTRNLILEHINAIWGGKFDEKDEWIKNIIINMQQIKMD